ncbi:MAG: 50S ribosomal protein L24 [Nanohaloarchaea archaeon]|nr:50S ribosomal protein L24 [Candidatus Nanohaloarchaea archaeon]
MKIGKWSVKWKGSKESAKQRKYLYNAPLHVKRKFLSANLSKTLRQKVGKPSLPVRRGDEVIIKRGSNKGSTGEIVNVFIKKGHVHIKGITTKKTDGTEVQLPQDPSNLQIISLNLEDAKRLKNIKSDVVKKDQSKSIKKEAVKKESKPVSKAKPEAKSGIKKTVTKDKTKTATPVKKQADTVKTAEKKKTVKK